jgi:hypothetical protein
MALYTVKVEKIHIDKTRSLFNDTDHVSASLRVGNETLPSQDYFAGNSGGGDVGVGIVFGPRLMTQFNTPMVLSYSVYNGDPSKLDTGLAQLTSSLVDKAVESMLKPMDPQQADITDFTDYPGAPDNPNYNFDAASWVKVLEFAALANLLSTDCDGFVALGTIGKEKKSWDALITAAGGTLEQSIYYPGTDSPPLCGNDSEYFVTWSVRRDQAPAAGIYGVRQFLSSCKITAQNGLRPLVPAETAISVRGLLN